MGAPDRRAAKREKHDAILRLSDASGRVLTGIVRLVDVSRKGARFASTESLEPGQAVRGQIRLMSMGVLDVSGHVVWRRAKGNVTLYGLAFDSAHPQLPEAGEGLGGTQ